MLSLLPGAIAGSFSDSDRAVYIVNGVNNLLVHFNAFVWDDDMRELSGVHRYLVFILRVIHLLIKELMGGQLNLRAMSLVYTTLLSIVPLLAVSFSVLKGFGEQGRIEPLLYNLLEPLGQSGIEITDRIIGFVENVKVGVLGSIGVVLLIYTVFALLQKIESAFNFVWQIDNQPRIGGLAMPASIAETAQTADGQPWGMGNAARSRTNPRTLCASRCREWPRARQHSVPRQH